jgi:hypothetical protein
VSGAAGARAACCRRRAAVSVVRCWCFRRPSRCPTMPDTPPPLLTRLSLPRLCPRRALGPQYDVFTKQRKNILQQLIRQAANNMQVGAPARLPCCCPPPPPHCPGPSRVPALCSWKPCHFAAPLAAGPACGSLRSHACHRSGGGPPGGARHPRCARLPLPAGAQQHGGGGQPPRLPPDRAGPGVRGRQQPAGALEVVAHLFAGRRGALQQGARRR